jgi:hypothetical protein
LSWELAHPVILGICLLLMLTDSGRALAVSVGGWARFFTFRPIRIGLIFWEYLLLQLEMPERKKEYVINGSEQNNEKKQSKKSQIGFSEINMGKKGFAKKMLSWMVYQ